MPTDLRVHRFARAVSVLVLSLMVANAASTDAAERRARRAAPQNEVDQGSVAQEITRNFTVLAITGGVVLTPRTPMQDVRSIELNNGTISIDGAPVTGAELRDKLGSAADVVLQLSYMSVAQQHDLAQSSAPPAEPAERPAPPAARRGPQSFDNLPARQRGGDVVHIGRDVRVEEGEVVHGNAVSVFGSATVLGEVRGDVVSIGGNVDLGPRAVVSGDVVAIGGTVNRAPGARIAGEVQMRGWGGARFSNWLGRAGNGRPFSGWPFGLGTPLALIAQIIRVGVLCLLALIVVLVAGRIVEHVGQRAAAEPLKAGAVGFLAQILFLPLLIVTIILLVVTIVGIPLLVLIPFAILGLLLVALVGFTAVAYRVGEIASARFSWTMGPYLRTVVGVIILLIPVLLARVIGLAGFPLSVLSFLLLCVGWLVEYVAWTVGFGAVALTRFAKSTAVAVPQPPPAP